jgi:Arc/MetJ-type ribon-helix-helix transcriptional regulator
MNILLTPEQAQRIQKHLRTGKYTSASEIIDQALHLLEISEGQPQSGKRLLKMFEKTGFLGSLPSSDPHLSGNYKAFVRSEMGSHHDSR